MSQIHLKLAGLAAASCLLAAPAAAQASPANALQPSNVYFGKVVAGQHPTRLVKVRNPTGFDVTFTRFFIAGAGGQKFTLVAKDAKGDVSTCRVGKTLRAGSTCTIIERVKTTKPEYWQAVTNLCFTADGGDVVGQFNGGTYAHVVGAES